MFVIYHKDTTRFLRILKNRYWEDAKYFATEAAAKACLTRLKKSGKFHRLDNLDDFLIADSDTFYNTIEKTEVVHNLLSGKPVTQSVNTPLCCDPSSETYHSR